MTGRRRFVNTPEFRSISGAIVTVATLIERNFGVLTNCRLPVMKYYLNVGWTFVRQRWMMLDTRHYKLRKNSCMVPFGVWSMPVVKYVIMLCYYIPCDFIFYYINIYNIYIYMIIFIIPIIPIVPLWDYRIPIARSALLFRPGPGGRPRALDYASSRLTKVKRSWQKSKEADKSQKKLTKVKRSWQKSKETDSLHWFCGPPPHSHIAK